jgi:glutamyl-tRNA reductase
LNKKAFVDFRFIHSQNVNQDVEELDGVTLIHMDYLSQLTDETLENRKNTFLLLKQSLRRYKRV